MKIMKERGRVDYCYAHPLGYQAFSFDSLAAKKNKRAVAGSWRIGLSVSCR
jgi:hypothetical protein